MFIVYYQTTPLQSFQDLSLPADFLLISSDIYHVPYKVLCRCVEDTSPLWQVVVIQRPQNLFTCLLMFRYHLDLLQGAPVLPVGLLQRQLGREVLPDGVRLHRLRQHPLHGRASLPLRLRSHPRRHRGTRPPAGPRPPGEDVVAVAGSVGKRLVFDQRAKLS